ncbi:MAG TPA: hypothetical protein DCQ97_05665, partial [Chitinophagaceae bacterium]|nr:hypothetical protein [Chitinophagaceae bacterium]
SRLVSRPAGTIHSKFRFFKDIPGRTEQEFPFFAGLNLINHFEQFKIGTPFMGECALFFFAAVTWHQRKMCRNLKRKTCRHKKEILKKAQKFYYSNRHRFFTLKNALPWFHLTNQKKNLSFPGYFPHHFPV